MIEPAIELKDNTQSIIDSAAKILFGVLDHVMSGKYNPGSMLNMMREVNILDELEINSNAASMKENIKKVYCHEMQLHELDNLEFTLFKHSLSKIEHLWESDLKMGMALNNVWEKIFRIEDIKKDLNNQIKMN